MRWMRPIHKACSVFRSRSEARGAHCFDRAHFSQGIDRATHSSKNPTMLPLAKVSQPTSKIWMLRQLGFLATRNNLIPEPILETAKDFPSGEKRAEINRPSDPAISPTARIAFRFTI